MSIVIALCHSTFRVFFCEAIAHKRSQYEFVIEIHDSHDSHDMLVFLSQIDVLVLLAACLDLRSQGDEPFQGLKQLTYSIRTY